MRKSKFTDSQIMDAVKRVDACSREDYGWIAKIREKGLLESD
jgi:hypothetical protein